MTNEEFPNDEGVRVWQPRWMDDLERRVAALEEQIREAWEEDPEQHPHMLDKQLAKLRGRLGALELEMLEVRAMLVALGSLESGPSDGLN
jgi:hypothetical protein